MDVQGHACPALSHRLIVREVCERAAGQLIAPA
eukprot:COSAG02_NODE_55906_length_288_cov_0.740741_1_plen_32_part_10